jgi:hypothetical protein
MAEFIHKNLPFVAWIAFMGMEYTGYDIKNSKNIWVEPKDYIAHLLNAVKFLDEWRYNESLIGLSRLQDSLTYFITSIRGNENLLSKLKFKLQVDELDADLIEDVNIEMTQAREKAKINVFWSFPTK